MVKSIFKKLIIVIGTILLCGNISAQTPTKTLQFATEATYPPFESVGPSGQLQGFDLDVANALCEKIQTKCTFVSAPFDSLIPSLKLNKYDVVFGAMDITPERSKQVDFTNPYFVNTAIFIVPKTAHFTATPAGLKGKTIGVQQGTTLGSYLQTLYDNTVTLKHYASVQDALLDLQSGRIDAVFSDTPVITDWIKKQGNGNYVTLGQPINDPHYFGLGYAFAVRKGNTQLLNALNQALAEIKKDGTLNKLVNQYFGQ
ncbi:MAG: lysine/arginine/ornithine ABC transporter substrate-binding protein [Gammaproteobacteria bacterium]